MNAAILWVITVCFLTGPEAAKPDPCTKIEKLSESQCKELQNITRLRMPAMREGRDYTVTCIESKG